MLHSPDSLPSTPHLAPSIILFLNSYLFHIVQLLLIVHLVSIPLQVYHRHSQHHPISPKIVKSNLLVSPIALEAPIDSHSILASLPITSLIPNDQFSITIRKGTHSTHNPHPICNFISSHHMSSSYYALILSVFYS